MKPMSPTHPAPCPSWDRQSGFALISVLALVSLAALTATAFLASSRLERQATRSIGETTRLAMTLNAGRECATEVLNNVAEPGYGWNFVTTYWRENPTNELGYLFVGAANSRKNLRWTYYCGFTPATWTSLDTNVVKSFVTVTNTVCQASYSNDFANFMKTATNGFTPNSTNPLCTQIPMVGGRTSPPVGWVYIKQDIRTNPASTNTASRPAARFAYFIEDLGGLIDAERMGAISTRPTGTNPEEISLKDLPNITVKDLTEYSKKRPQYITPGMLLSANGGVLGSNTNLSYFASRLRYCYWSNGTDWDRIPTIPISSTEPYYPTNAGYLKRNLNTNLTAAKLDNIVSTITNNFRNFANRAGGMIGTNYVYALAANMIDYADTDPNPTTTSPAGSPIAGFDNYPLPTIIFDQLNLAGKILTVNSYWQFWNCSSVNSPPITYDYTYDFADFLGSYEQTSTKKVVQVPGSPRMIKDPLKGQVTVPALNAGNSAIVRITTATNLESATLIPSSVLASDVKNIWIDGTTSGQIITNNMFTLTLKGQVISKLMTGFERKAKRLDNGGASAWSGGMPGLRYDNVAGIKTSFKVPPSGDPRMLLYFTNNVGTGYLSACDYDQNVEWELGYAQTRKDAFNGSPYSGMPGNWIDGSNSAATVILGKPYPDAQAPSVGTFSSKNSAANQLSTNKFGLFTNICELGNIFDPIQWVSTSITNPSMWVNCDIAAGTTWTANSMYGGGQTLRIGRPEHSRFAFTNLDSSKTSYPVPSLGTSAAGLMDLFCVTNAYNWAGKININTAPLPVLAALAGGITLSKDANIKGSTMNSQMVSAFTNGVAQFRSTYPFISPSQLAFISTNYGSTGWTNSSVWTQNAVFGTNTFGGLKGVTSLNDEGREEWFSKIYNLTTVQSFNYRIYVVAQLVDTNGVPKGSMMRKYYQVYLRNNTPQGSGDTAGPSVSPTVTYEAFY